MMMKIKMKMIPYQGVFDDRFDGIYRIDKGMLIPGKARNVYIHNGEYYLSQLKVYADGMIDCWNLVNLEEFKQKITDGWIVLALPEGAELNIHMLGSFTATGVMNYISPENLIKEVKDTIAELNNKPTSLELCRRAYDVYGEYPSIENKKKLRTTYYAMPEHMRVFVLGDMNAKDSPITSIIDVVDIQEVEATFPYGKDKRFIELYKQVVEGKLSYYWAMIDIAGIHPRNEAIPVVSESFREHFVKRYLEKKPISIHVYPEEDVFIMSDDYMSFTLYKELGVQRVPCLVLGEPHGTYVHNKLHVAKPKGNTQA